jgi:hypothetical protein
MIKQILASVILSLLVGTVFAKSGNQISACEDLDTGDLCSFMNNEGDDIDGTCHFQNANDEGTLLCVPVQ